MSYILDALKRADAERARGTVPGLHAQPQPGKTPASSDTRARWLWPVAAIVLVLAGLAALTWVWRGQAGDEAAPVAVTVAPVAPPVVPQAVTAPQPMPAVAPAVQPAAPPAIAPAPPVTPPAAVAPRTRVDPAAPAQVAVARPTKPGASGIQDTGPRPAPVPTTPKPGASATLPAAAPSAAPAASAAPAPPATAPLIGELPEEFRRLIPALAITGAVYSENPAQRLLLVNGLVLPQGATAAPEVMIEEIRSRSATFTFRGTRFRVTY